MNSLLRLCLVAATGVLLAACQDGKITVAVSAEPPSNATQQLVVTISGVSFQRDDGSIDRIDLSKPVKVDLLRYDTLAYSLISGDTLKAATYNGIQLHFVDSTSNDSDNYVITSVGGQEPLTLPNTDSDMLPIKLTVKKTGKSYTVQTRIDLALSLADDSNGRELLPLARAARDTQAATISGTVSDSTVRSSSCQQGRAAGVGVAVYLFSGSNITPDDRDGSIPDPVASAPVKANSSGGWSYDLRVLPAGDYTMALTCDADAEDAIADDNIDFIGGTHNITLADGDSKTYNFN